jgi:hypothetical protein
MSFKTISSADIKTTRTTLNQLIDFVEEDISGSSTRKTYQVFVTSSKGPLGSTSALTSSLFHTVFDQDFNLQTANEIFDMTVGIFSGSQTVTGSRTGQDINGKILFNSRSVMMREKINIYRQFAQNLLGNADSFFTSPFSNASTTGNDNIDEALFFCFKRLFVRDGIKRESFAMKLFASSSAGATHEAHPKNVAVTRINPATGSIIITDVGSSNNIERSNFGGDVGNLVLASNTSKNVGLVFYQQGIVILDMAKVFKSNQVMSGTISCVGDNQTMDVGFDGDGSQFIPGFVTSASIDDILTHIATTRFGSGSNTFCTFQNNTKINSTLVFCRATADEFNYSSNPTYTDANGRILVIDETQQNVQKSFSFVTTIGLYDANEQLLAVSKLSRPVEKNDEKDLTFRVRLDF